VLPGQRLLKKEAEKMAKIKRSLGDAMKPTAMVNYPHMMAEDRDIWTKFLEIDGYEIEKVWYDVHCGLGLPVIGGTSSMEYKISQGVTRKRIDVVCTVKNEIWIVEIKPHANMKALGQIITYEKLFREEYSTPYKIIPVVLCWTMDPDIGPILKDFGIRVLQAGSQ